MVYEYDRCVPRRVKEVGNMPLWLAVVLLASAVIGIVLCRKYLRRNKTVRILGISICVLLALACILYIGLTLLFVDAVQNQPPAL